MYRHPSYSENNDWEDLNQSQRGNSNIQQYHHYGNERDPRFSRPDNSREHNQNREDNFGSGYGLNPENRRNQDYNFDYDQPERSRNQYDDFRGAYRLDTERTDAGYRQLNDRNFGEDYGYGHAGSSRTGGDYGRDQSDYGTGGTYGASRNAGSMGSYGGAQGYGSSRGGHNTSNDPWTSGHHDRSYQPQHRIYGAYRDRNSFAEGEKETYDGTTRYGSQGADTTRGWLPSGRSGVSGNRATDRSSDDARYEIYDSALSQYNRGEYGNTTGGSISEELNLRTHQNYPPYQYYGSHQRGFRQGSGNDQDSQLGTDMEYGNTAGSLSVGYDGFYGEPGPRNRYYDPLTGDVRNPGAERNL
ncbi:hypothetical protein [Adhaeribacter soli]|uniref:Uncharacterized protein n=1 Tax=Adhaeribacter soli TaxID=2607655 RepID=A0A5N1J292_9BACT|nr:hypothetical protein [Adhaeribacter soli]KAA9340699.1 hypothetical protein F0P94_04540 [Adhaeribacter soli]